MNVHAPQSLQTRNELIQLAAVPTQIITPKDSKPIVSIVQDVALGVYRISKDIVLLSEKQMMNLMCPNPKFNGTLPTPSSARGLAKLWSGRQALSSTIPPNVNYRGANKSFDENKADDKENFVVIENGEIKQGRLDTKVYQDRTKGLVHSIFNEYGPDETRQFFDNTQQLICNWLVLNGFSVGISDLVVDENTNTSLKTIINDMKVKVYDIIRDIHMKKFQNNSRKSENDNFEEEVNKLLNDAINKAGKVGLEKIDDLNNRMINMIKAGAKGNTVNISQMIACLGQQNIDGKRIAYGFDSRTLPHYTKYDDGPDARGFVENSFIKGLTPQEFFFHSMGGREGLIDTAVKSVTGDTPVVLMENGRCVYTPIGDWIDTQLDRQAHKVQHFTERQMELLNLEKEVYIPTTDEHGKVTWGAVTAITRHDPGTELYEIKTVGGRSVIVTESKSLLTWHPELQQFKEVNTPDIKVGDFVPVTAELADPPSVVNTLGEFALDYKNGVFAGLYLATGGNVYNPECVEFAKSWIASNDMGKFLDTFVGLRQRIVPSVAFVAPQEFVKGFLSGYFSAVDEILAGEGSRRLVEGIAMLCSRLGAFCNIGSGKVVVSGRGAAVLADCLQLLVEEKQRQLEGAKNATTKQECQGHNNVVLDKIVEINVIDVSKYPKVYDLTIPSTLNFGLANGLQVRDTSQTGYIQRKLVKAMEDCKVSYDMTVRNANGNIIQFLYGEDGIDAIKIENQPLHYVSMTPEKMEQEYMITSQDDLSVVLAPEAIRQLKSTPEWKERMFKHFTQLHEDREYFIKKMFGGEQETAVLYPVSFMRIINNVHSLCKTFNVDGVMSDLTPTFVLDEIERLCAEVFVSRIDKGTKLFEMLARLYLSPKQMIFKYGFDIAAFKQVVQQVKLRFFDSIVHPSEMVGVVAAQSIGEPLSQTTLNSVEWNTELLLDIDGQLQRVKIGEYVDHILKNAAKSDIELHPNDTSLAWVKDKDVKIMSCDTNGTITWKRVEAVTRHPVINKDGSNTLIKVTLKSGRQVTATKGHSFLKRVNNQIVGVDGDTLTIDDYLPVSTVLPTQNLSEMNKWDVSVYLPRSKYLYMSEVEKALAFKESAQSRHWFKANNGNAFTVPYSRSDSFVDAYLGVGKNKGEGRRKNIIEARSDCVYPKNVVRQPAHIPENLPLDATTGFFIGAYLAEGCCTTHHVLIANVDMDFNKRIEQFCQAYDIKYHIDDRQINNGRSKTLRLHSLILAQLLKTSIGTGAANKRLPPEMFAAPREFLANVVDGYFSGDGTVSNKQRSIMATSISKGLIEDIQQLLTKFGIKSIIKAEQHALEINTKRFPNAKLPYSLSIQAEGVVQFKKEFTLTLSSKQQRLDKMSDIPYQSKLDVIPNVITEQFGDLTIRRSEIDTYIDKCSGESDRKVFERLRTENVFYDKIVSIEDVQNEHLYAYDLTVADTRTFNVYNGVTQFDTFHLSGVSSASKAVRGVPRIEELTRVTKNVKAPSIVIYLREEYSKSKEKCMEIKNKIETTTFRDIFKFSKIYFDPSDANTTIEGDSSIVELYKEYQLEEDCDRNVSPWLLRLELDRAKMLDKGLTMIDLHHALLNHFGNRVSCMFSDDNAANLIFRIKLYEDVSEDSRDMLTDLKAMESTILENVLLKGIERLNKVEILKKERLAYQDDSRTFQKSHEWCLDTDGTNLIEVLGLPYVDATRTVSNDVNEVYQIFGIEAARQCLYNEIYSVIKDAEAHVNFRHLSLLVDTMTSKGALMSIDRHGINKGDIGPLAKCSFEEVNDVLVKAGVFSELDRVNGVSANIMLGQIAPCGTGDTEILIDETKLRDPKESARTNLPRPSWELSDMDLLKEETCLADNFRLDFAVPEVDPTIQKKKAIPV